MTWTKHDELVGLAPHNGRIEPPVTIRRWFEHGAFRRAEVFVGGWRVGIYKTEAGATRRAKKETR